MRSLVAAVIAVLLAGCSESSPPAEAGVTMAPSSSSTGPGTQAAPTTEVLPFSFDGNLGTFAHGCVLPANTCHRQVVVARAADLLVERPGVNVSALSFEVTWQAQSAATESLTVGSMVMYSCDGCNSTNFGEVEGKSPLRVEVSGVDVPMNASAVIHVYLYNPQGFVYDPAVPAYGLVSIEQAFRIEGTATLLVPPG